VIRIRIARTRPRPTSSRRLVAVLATLALITPVTLAVTTRSAAAAGPGTNYAWDDPFTSARTSWWRDDRFGMFIHFGDYSYWEGEYTRPDGTVCQNAEWILNRCSIPMAQYEAAAAKFNPSEFNGDTIATLARDAGQKYIVITSKHHDGYAMWPTKVNTWNLHDHSSFNRNRDILAELKAAADRQGIKFGLYYSILDWHNPNFTSNFAQYKRDMYAQLKELIDNYDPALLWFDGQWPSQWTTADAEDLQTYLRVLKPDLVVDNRVGKRRLVDGDYGTPEQQIPADQVEGQPWESCMTINGHWGFARYDGNWKSTTTLTRNLVDIASRSGNYLLNIGPDSLGRVPAASVERLRGMGSWLNANGQGSAVYSAGRAGVVADPSWGAVSRGADNKLYLSVYTWPAAGTPLHLQVLDPFQITAARVLGSNQQVTWQAAGDGFDIVPSGSATNPIATVIELSIATQPRIDGTGTGLRAQYWTNATFSGTPAVTRTDPTLNFAWRFQGSPAASIPVDNFSARWTGSVRPQYSDTYTFLTVSDETVRVWVDGRLIIDNATPHQAAVNRGTIALEAGRQYSIRVDYTELTGEAYLKLLWFSPNLGQRIVPAAQLYPSAPPPTARYEAENATISQGAVESNHAGFSGTGFVNYDNVAGSHVQWTVNAAQAGPAALTFRYANGSTARPMDVTVNGALAADELAFPPTGAWTTWQTVTTVVNLNAGANTIRASATTANGGPNVDYLEAQVQAPPPPTTRYEAEDATISQGVAESDHAGFSGTGFVNYDNLAGSYAQWTVTAAQAGSATLTFRYANGTTANRPMDVTVNGTLVADELAFPPTGAWTTWQTVTTTAPLNAGTNTIRATATTANGGPNVDYLEVTQ
jgi:alpha-L-fucosidase